MLEYVSSADSVGVDMLVGGFFEGWPQHPDAAEHLRTLRQSDFVEVAFDGRQVVGFVSAISDGALSAYIPLLEVLPSYRGKGVGSELMRRLLVRLEDLYIIDVSCDDDVVEFYERFGLRRIVAMGRRNYAAQAGEFGLPAASDVVVAVADHHVAQICTEILAELPTWFGIPEANADYITASVANESLVAYDDNQAVGILTIVEHGSASAEVHLMAVRPQAHRRGIGRALLADAERRFRERGIRFLQVKTLSERHSDPGYALTRAFYRSQGFVALEEFPDLWGAESPALQMIKTI